MQAGRIAEDRHLVAGVDGQHDPGDRGRRLDGVDRFLGQTAEVQLGERDPQPAASARVGQEILGHALELLRVALDGLEHAHLALGQIRLGVEQQFDEAPDGRDRRAQLVRHRGHDVVLHLGQLAQAVVLLDQRLRHFLLDGEEALSVGGQLLALGHVDGDDHVAAVGRGLRRLVVLGHPAVRSRPRPASSTASASSGHSSSRATSGVGTGRARTRTTQRRCWPSLRVAVHGTSAAVSASTGSRAVRMASIVWRRSSIWAGSMKSAMELDPHHLGRAVAEHLFGPGREEGHGPGRVDAHDGAPGGGPQQRLEPVPGVVGLAGVAPGDAGLLGQVAQEGPVPRDHRVDGRGHQRRDRRHDGDLAPLEGRVLGRTDDEEWHQEGQIHDRTARRAGAGAARRARARRWGGGRRPPARSRSRPARPG